MSSSAPGQVAVAVGTFDGIHLGHRALLATAAGLAAKAHLELVALTFDRHPLTVLRPELAPRLLTGLEHKIELLAPLLEAPVRVLSFDAERAAQPAESFVLDTLVGELGARLVVVGENFRFGNANAGNVATLTEVGATAGLHAVGVPLSRTVTGVAISSTQIRDLIDQGRVAEASALLGRPHEVRGSLGRAGAGELVMTVPGELLLPPPGSYRALVGRSTALRGGVATVEPASSSDPTTARTVHVDLASGELEGSGALRVAFLAPLREQAGPLSSSEVSSGEVRRDGAARSRARSAGIEERSG